MWPFLKLSAELALGLCVQILANDGHVGHQVLAWFFFVWWLAGGCAGTFSAPFGTLSNGYFAAWAGIFISGLFLAIVSPIFKSFADKAKSAILVNEAVLDQVGLVIASIIEVIAASVRPQRGPAFCSCCCFELHRDHLLHVDGLRGDLLRNRI